MTVARNFGRLRVRLANSADDVEAAQRLRARAFLGIDGLDSDGFDGDCDHLLIEDRSKGALMGCCRLLPLSDGAEIGRSYSARFYDLSALMAFGAPMVELGRFCLHPDQDDPDILRAAFAALTGYVDRCGAQLLFGCASFAGTDARAYDDAFALLSARYLAPRRWRPRVKAPDVVRFAARRRGPPDPVQAMLGLPPLLRTYLMMGGWVSDHAVIDHAMNTLHVFTGVETGAIPAARQRVLRAALQG